MKRLFTYILLPLLLAGSTAFAQEKSMLDSISLGNAYNLNANVNLTSGSCLFEKSPEADISNALYGQFSGLLVKNSSSTYDSNQSKLKLSLRLHGHSPLVLVDGLPRDIEDLSGLEIESVSILKDAAAAALYGVKGGNGVVMITTKRGKDSPLKVSGTYQYGFATMFRAPEFADAYTYGFLMNEARSLDGLPAKYNDAELYALYTGQYPYAYPNVNWWNEVYRDHGDNHRAQFTFQGGNKNFRYFAALDYLKEDFLYKKATADDRYNANHYDNRLGIRANVDVNITKSTSMKIGVMARLAEYNQGYYSGRIESTLYNLPAAFPVKQADGTYGGTSLYGAVNPVAVMQENGQRQWSQTKVLADALLRQDLGSLLEGLWVDVNVGFDYIGLLYERASKDWQYSELVSNIAAQGNQSYILSNQVYYGVNSKTVDFDHYFKNLQMRFELQGRINWARDFGKNHLEAHAGYRMRSWILSGQNNSSKTQEYLGSVSYDWNKRIFVDAVVNYSGTAYIPKDGKRFNWYPAISVAGVILPGDPYIKAYASAGMSGSDGDLEHELWRQSYVSGNSYYFGINGGTGYSGRTEGDMAAVTLAPELSRKATVGLDMKFFGGRLGLNADGFLEHRSNILISPSNISGVIGIGVNEQSLGEQSYKGVDAGIDWNETRGNFNYGLYANGGWLFTKIINDGQAYQMYDYLYHKGNPVGQKYGLEVIGIFQNQMEINNSPRQTFGTVSPGDLKYRDQNGDGVIDKQDRVKMFGSSTPLLQFGFGLHAGWKGLKVYADFQGVTGVTIDLLDSPLYQPLVDNGTISNTFLNREITWAPGREQYATMPRLTTQENPNNYQANSLWYRDGSFIKLRNVGISYTFPESLLRLCEATIFVRATNLFSLDNIQFADPEQLGAYYPSTRTFWGGITLRFGHGNGKKAATRKKSEPVEMAPPQEVIREVVKEVVKEVPVEVVKEKVVVKEVVKEVPAKALKVDKYEDNLFFIIGKAELRPEEAFKLGQIAQLLKDNPDLKIQVMGYADSATGSADRNKELSAQRAAVVVDMLRKAGIAASRIQSGSVGSDRDASSTPESNRVAVCIIK